MEDLTTRFEATRARVASKLEEHLRIETTSKKILHDAKAHEKDLHKSTLEINEKLAQKDRELLQV